MACPRGHPPRGLRRKIFRRGRKLEAEITEVRAIVRPAALGPAEFALVLRCSSCALSVSTEFRHRGNVDLESRSGLCVSRLLRVSRVQFAKCLLQGRHQCFVVADIESVAECGADGAVVIMPNSTVSKPRASYAPASPESVTPM